ncbi:hypothetical protein BA059_05060 [Mycolicibacterium sp. (ex Dasyatis americana)]|uniref:hypothetical protein n=1 Tax=Mycobacterium sp. DBP42 TaxID=2545267 RepID=UPI000873413C|nr:hypothetical protein [Mycobacterium sp. DBP42]OFB42578.1 hypothetical protein BA059_05060 [Mycolicibacterium sp. (ex Dasyatis americana)]TMS50392.1 hypothetical protein E0T84_24085 [Mycobacterium sp. DBP42]
MNEQQRGEVVVTEGTPIEIVKVAADAEAQSMVGEGQWVDNLELETGRPVGGEDGTQVLWPFTFDVSTGGTGPGAVATRHRP